MTFTPAAFPSLTIANPQIWWPYQLGAQPLYTLATSVAQGSTTLNSTSGTFGIRTVTSYLTGASSHRAQRRPRLQDQQRADRDPRRRLRPRPVPALLGRRHRQADRADEGPGRQHHPARGPPDAGRLLPADGRGRHPDQRRLPVLRLLGGDHLHQRRPGRRTSCPRRRSGRSLRNHPSVFSFQWSDNAPTTTQETLALNGFAAADYTGPFISSAEYKSSPQLGAAGEKEGPYDWVPPNYWYDTTHSGRRRPDQLRRLVGLRQRAERRQHRADARLDQPVPVRGRPVGAVADAGREPVPQQLRGHQAHRVRLRHAVQPRHRRSPTGTAPGPASASTSRRRRSPTTRTPARSSRRSSTTPPTPRHRPPAPSTGSSTRAGRRCSGRSTTTTATRPARTSARRRPTRRCTRSTRSTTTPSPLDNLGGASQAGLTVESKVYNTAGTLLDDRTSGALTLASQQVAEQRAHADRADHGEHGRTSSSCCCGRTARSSTATSTGSRPRRTSSTGTRRSATRRRSMTSYANLKALQSLPHGDRRRDRDHRQPGRPERRRPADHRHHHQQLDHARPSASSCGPTSGAVPPAAPNWPATTNCRRRSGAATTSRCGPVSPQTITVDLAVRRPAGRHAGGQRLRLEHAEDRHPRRLSRRTGWASVCRDTPTTSRATPMSVPRTPAPLGAVRRVTATRSVA